ncbi:MAG: YheT family hydrolase [Candidatus Reddybacter sp.]
MGAHNSYKTRYLGRFGHFQTIYPSLFRRVQNVPWRRERITTADGDFIDLDWLVNHCPRLLLLCHGLEGSSDTHYIKGMARACASAGWDVVAYNFRGCSGEPNRVARSYHSGSSDDLAFVISHALAARPYRKLALTGFSLGGNQVLKYLGEHRDDRPPQLCGGTAISPPCDLSACSDLLEQGDNWLYKVRFLRSLLAKVDAKRSLIEAEIGALNTKKCRSIREFDEHFVAPLNGFASAEDYYQRSSSRQFLSRIEHPVLLLSSFDDPLLAPSCYPSAAEINNARVRLAYTPHGGHVSFMQAHPQGWYWGEQKNVKFLESIASR